MSDIISYISYEICNQLRITLERSKEKYIPYAKDKDLEIGYAILLLLSKSGHINNFNKKAIYLMIRDITDCKTSDITKIVKELKVILDRQYKYFQKTGRISEYFDK